MANDLDIFLNAPENAPPEQLAAYLDESCAGDPALRARVEALFSADRSTQAIADHAPGMPGGDAPPLATSMDSVGTTIGPYKLLQKIGEGGFGNVYMAEQFQPVRRRVAFKIIKLGMDTRQVVARFEAERQALAMMDHPNIAKVHDAGATENGRPYFVMELVRGIPITQFCDEQNLDTRELLGLFVDVCRAVQHAHQKGVIHRDLKPSNVMVTMHDDLPVVKVIDFGVAKAIQTDLTDKTLFTQFEQFIGTPAYMSPEQAQFSGLDIDTRSDIYTLGVLLYELLTGTTPFDSQELQKAGYDEIRRIIKEDEPARPSVRLSTLGEARLTTLAKHRHTQSAKLPGLVKGDLDWIVMKALEKNRTRRYETANALAADIGRHLADEPVTAAAPGPAYLLSKFVRRHRALLGTAATIVAVLLVASVVSTWKAIEAGRAQADAENAALVAQRASTLAKDATARERQQKERSTEQALAARHRLADTSLATGKTALGITHLARLIREDPSNPVAAERMLTALRMHPMPEPLHYFEGVRVAKLNRDGSKVALGLRNQTVEVRDTETGGLLQEMTLSGPATITSIQFSPDDQLVMTHSMEPGEVFTSTAEVFRLNDGQRMCPPLELAAKSQTCTFSPDSKLVLMGCPGKTGVWDMETGQLCFDLITEYAYMGTFSPDSRLIAFTTGRVYNSRTGERLEASLQKPNGVANYSVHFSPDGTKIIGGSSDGLARIWDVETGEGLGLLPHDDNVSRAEFSPGGGMIATKSHDGIVRLWDATTLEKLREFTQLRRQLTGSPTSLFSADGRRLVGTFEGGAWIWDVHGNGEGTHAKLQPGAGSELSPDHSFTLSSGGFGKTGASLQRFPVERPRCQIFRQPENTGWSSGTQGIRRAALSPDGEVLVTGATANWMGVWNTRTGKLLDRLPQRGGIKHRVEFSSDSSLILTVTAKLDGGGVKIWDARTREQLCYHTGEGSFRHVAFSPERVEGDYLFVAAPEGVDSAQMYKARTGEPVGEPLTYGGPLSDADYPRTLRAMFDPDAKRIVTTSLAGHVRVWSVPEGKLLQELEHHHEALIAAMFSPDGRRIVTASEDGTAGIWKWNEASSEFEFMQSLLHGSDRVVYAEFSPDSRNVATSSFDGSARIWTWDGEAYAPRAVMRHDKSVHLARFSPDGRRLLTASIDHTAQVWDVQSGLPLSGPLRHDGIVTDARWNRDGTQVVTAGADTTARLWDLPPAPRGVVPEWVAEWGEAVAGLRINANGAIEPVAVEKRLAMKQRILALPDDDYWAKTAKWTYANPKTRPITPFSKMGLADWIENRKNPETEHSVASLQEALRVAPDDPTVQMALARATMESPTDDKAVTLRRAHFLASHTAAATGPERHDLLRDIQRAEYEELLYQRLTELEAEIEAATEAGHHGTAQLLLRPMVVGATLVFAELEQPLPTWAKQNQQNLINLAVPAPDHGEDAPISRQDYLAGLTDKDLQHALTLLVLPMPRDHARANRERWGAALLNDRLPESREELALRARVQGDLGRLEAELAALAAALAAFPDRPGERELREQAGLMRRQVRCLNNLDRHEDAQRARTSLFALYRGPGPDSNPLQLDLSKLSAEGLVNREPPAEGSPEYWTERLPEIFDPGDGPDFDISGFVPLNSAEFPEDLPQAWQMAGKDYATLQGIDYPYEISIPVGQKFGAIHFLQSVHWARELPGVEVAHYIIHYDDRSPERIPVIFGQDTTDFWIHERHANYKQGVNLVWTQDFKTSRGRSGTQALARQSWTNPHPESTVTHLDFVSNRVKAAPFLAGITLETSEQLRERTKGFKAELARLEAKLAAMTSLHDPATVRKRRTLLRRKLALLKDLGRHEEAAGVDAEIVSVPPRPPGLPEQQVNLDGAYTESFFRPGTKVGRLRDEYWERVPESFELGEGPDFDLRGVIQLESGVFNQQPAPLLGKTVGQHYGLPSPSSVTITIGQKFHTIHFLHTALFGREEPGTEVARYILHYEDGSKHSIPVRYGFSFIDSVFREEERGKLGNHEDLALNLTFPDNSGRQWNIVFTRQTAPNPHPDKLVTHIEFESVLKSAAPILAGITVE